MIDKYRMGYGERFTKYSQNSQNIRKLLQNHIVENQNISRFSQNFSVKSLRVTFFNKNLIF